MLMFLAGNAPLQNLSRGCKVYLPVFVEGANLSMGDIHFSVSHFLMVVKV